jgi:hypothetical protein
LVAKGCTVTVTDSDGKRHSIDVRAESSFDAAHLYLTTAKAQSPAMMPEPLPEPGLATVLEIVADGKIHHVRARHFQRWIVKRRGELKEPKGFLFNQRRAME